MSGWKTKVFGDTSFNFYGWIGVGLLVLGLSAREIALALRVLSLDQGKAMDHLLLAIWIVLFGQFGLSMQNYCARAAKNLDDKDPK